MAEKMSDQELGALLVRFERSAIGYRDGALSALRQENMNYYLGKPFGNEKAGRSSVVSSDVADTIEWIIPQLMEIFASSDDVGSFEPQGIEDEENAKQATEYCNYMLMRDNPGFRILYVWFKDGLLARNGFIKVMAEQVEDIREKVYKGLPPDALAVLTAEAEAQGAEVVEKEDSPDGMKCCAVRMVKTQTRIKVVNAPPEDVLVAESTVELPDSPYVAHRARRSKSSLIEDGYKPEDVESLRVGDGDDLSGEAIIRAEEDDRRAQGDEEAAPGEELVWIYDAYLTGDFDGTGKSGRIRVVYGYGAGGTVILEREKWDGPIPIIDISPIYMPHQFLGMSVAELVKDIQLIKSTLVRQIMDNIYQTNNPRDVVDPNKIDVDDYINGAFGAPIKKIGGGPIS